MSVGKGWCSRFHTPVCSYKFHALTVYLHSTFTVSHFIWGEAFLQKQSTSQALGYFCRRAPSCIFDKMSDRILNATLPNNSLQFEEGLRRSFSGVTQRNLGLPCLLILLIYTSNYSSTSQVDKANTCDLQVGSYPQKLDGEILPQLSPLPPPSLPPPHTHKHTPLHSGILTEAISIVRVLNQEHKFHAPTATEHKYDKTRIEN